MKKEELSKRLVIDANIFLNYFLENKREPTVKIVESIIKNVLDGYTKVFMPDIIVTEVMYNLKKKATEDNQSQLISRLFINFIKSEGVLLHKIDTKELNAIERTSRIFEISFYDACYLYLSVNLGFPLITMDKPFYNKIKKDYPETILVK